MRIHRANTRAQQLCAHRRCSVVIDRRFLMCLTHWNAVPVTLRREIAEAVSAYRNADTGDNLHALQRLQAEAIALVA